MTPYGSSTRQTHPLSSGGFAESTCRARFASDRDIWSRERDTVSGQFESLQREGYQPHQGERYFYDLNNSRADHITACTRAIDLLDDYTEEDMDISRRVCMISVFRALTRQRLAIVRRAIMDDNRSRKFVGLKTSDGLTFGKAAQLMKSFGRKSVLRKEGDRQAHELDQKDVAFAILECLPPGWSPGPPGDEYRGISTANRNLLMWCMNTALYRYYPFGQPPSEPPMWRVEVSLMASGLFLMWQQDIKTTIFNLDQRAYLRHFRDV